MDQYKVNRFEQGIRYLIVFGSLLFSINTLIFYPLGSSLRYYIQVLAAISLIYLFISRHRIDWHGYYKSFAFCCVPFLPFLIVFALIKIYHGLGSLEEVHFLRLTIIVLASSIVFGVLTQCERVPKNLFFGCCAAASVVYFTDVVFTAYMHKIPVWAVKGYVHPVATTYAHCISLSSGLSLLGFFLLSGSEKKIRLVCLISSILGFCATIWFIGIRSVVLVPLFALIIGYCVSPLKRRTKVLTLICFGVLTAIVIIQSPMVSKMRLAYEEAANVISTDAVTVILRDINKKKISPQDEKKQKYLNTSVGARLAVWGIAKKVLEEHTWLGTGLENPKDFVDTRKLFKFSRDYLRHFHSDYVQVVVVGGLVLLVAFLSMQIWLLVRSFGNPLTLFLTLSMISYGIFDFGFLDRRVFLCYVGANLIIWSWYYPSGQLQRGSES